MVTFLSNSSRMSSCMFGKVASSPETLWREISNPFHKFSAPTFSLSTNKVCCKHVPTPLVIQITVLSHHHRPRQCQDTQEEKSRALPNIFSISVGTLHHRGPQSVCLIQFRTSRHSFSKDVDKGRKEPQNCPTKTLTSNEPMEQLFQLILITSGQRRRHTQDESNQ